METVGICWEDGETIVFLIDQSRNLLIEIKRIINIDFSNACCTNNYWQVMASTGKPGINRDKWQVVASTGKYTLTNDNNCFIV